MIRTVEAVIDERGNVRLLERAEAALLSEAALAEDWVRPEEDEAWKHLQKMEEGRTRIADALVELIRGASPVDPATDPAPIK